MSYSFKDVEKFLFFCSCLNTVHEVEGKNWLMLGVVTLLDVSFFSQELNVTCLLLGAGTQAPMGFFLLMLLFNGSCIIIYFGCNQA